MFQILAVFKIDFILISFLVCGIASCTSSSDYESGNSVDLKIQKQGNEKKDLKSVDSQEVLLRYRNLEVMEKREESHDVAIDNTIIESVVKVNPDKALNALLGQKIGNCYQSKSGILQNPDKKEIVQRVLVSVLGGGGVLEKRIAQEISISHIQRIMSCYEILKSDNQCIEDTLVVEIVISNVGIVQKEKVGNSLSSISKRKECVEEVIGQWQFPALPDHEDVKVKLIFEFNSSPH